eukprot:m.222816 g.222816  ORF g.222816 m.222816 type:complete len:159 (-) comp17025_c2_seq9:186-662(-)
MRWYCLCVVLFVAIAIIIITISGNSHAADNEAEGDGCPLPVDWPYSYAIITTSSHQYRHVLMNFLSWMAASVSQAPRRGGAAAQHMGDDTLSFGSSASFSRHVHPLEVLAVLCIDSEVLEWCRQRGLHCYQISADVQLLESVSSISYNHTPSASRPST